MIETVFLFLGLFYGGLILFFYIGIRRERARKPASNHWQPLVSVLVPARNEAAHIIPTLQSLAAQTYPASRLEVIVIDDHSSDCTGETVRQFIAAHGLAHFQLLVHRLDGIQPTYKKSAIAFALQSARGEIIMTTDADCRVQPNWVASMVSCYDAETGMVAGLAALDSEHEKTLFHKLQTLEFAGLVFAGVGAVGNHYPLICNGSNLSYRKAAYHEVGGFAGHDHVPSGDDDLFMQNVHHYTRWKVRYNLDFQAVNFTRPVDTLPAFLNQRARWASKGTHYPGFKTLLILLLIYFFYASLLIMPIVAVAGRLSGTVLLAGFLLKLLPEFLVLSEAVKVLQRRELLRWFAVAEIFHVPYIVLTGLRGFFKLYRWKRGA